MPEIVEGSVVPAPVVEIPPRPELWAIVYFKAERSVWFLVSASNEEEGRKVIARDPEARFLIRVPAGERPAKGE